MASTLQKCTVCGGLLDEEDLFCANCGTEAPEVNKQETSHTQLATHNFACEGCGASMSYDASAQRSAPVLRLGEVAREEWGARTGRIKVRGPQSQAVDTLRQWLPRASGDRAIWRNKLW
jgi:hypothetical protein